MNFRFTLVLLVLAILVIGGVAVVQKNNPGSPTPTPSGTPQPAIFNFPSGDATVLDITSKGHETRLAMANGKWALVKPEQDPNVDQSRVSGVVGQLASLKGTRTVTKATAANLGTYGLERPQATVVVTLKGNKTDTLLLGNKSIDGTAYYAMSRGGATVDLIDSALGDSLLGFASAPPTATPTPTPVPTTAATPTP
ncbi:MAG: DUF4340 domain-containing protein [Chloroflexota bacterium]